jgi:hypothetical protein
VISHDDVGDAFKHHEDRRKRRALRRDKQGYTCREGGDAAESREGKPVPAHKRHNRQPFLEIDDDFSDQPFGVPKFVPGTGSAFRTMRALEVRNTERARRAAGDFLTDRLPRPTLSVADRRLLLWRRGLQAPRSQPACRLDTTQRAAVE